MLDTQLRVIYVHSFIWKANKRIRLEFDIGNLYQILCGEFNSGSYESNTMHSMPETQTELLSVF